MRKFALLVFFYLSLSIVLFFPSLLLAGTTGKITGVIVDSDTKEPLVGVNVQIEGTVLGGATDLDGFYFIINIAPGKHTVVASYLGYASKKIEGVSVKADQTTSLNIELDPSAIQGEVVTVVAKKPIVEADRTFATSSVSDEDFEVMPVTSVNDAVQIQAGVVDGHFRGGRSGEVLYLVDGIAIQDVYDNSQGVQVNQSVVQELQVISGSFNAEYGQALSGVVNMITKEGADNYSGSFSAHFGDYLSTHKDEFLYIDNVNPNSIFDAQGTLSGPIPVIKGLSFFVNARQEENEGWMYGERRWDLDKFFETTENLPEGLTDAMILDSLQTIDPSVSDLSDEKAFAAAMAIWGRGDGNDIPMNPDSKTYLYGKLSYQMTPTLKLNYISLFDNRNYKDFDRDFIYNPEGDFKRFRRNRSNILKLTTTLSNSSFLEVGLANNYTQYHHYVFEDILDSRYHSPAWLDNNPSYTMKIVGEKWEHFRRFTNTNSAQAKYAWQVNPIHYIQAGANYSLNEVYFHSVFDQAGEYQLSERLIPAERELNNDKFRYFPYEYAIYLQDKIELKSLIINAGIRFDYFNSAGKVPTDEKDPDMYNPIFHGLNETVAQREQYWYKDAEAKTQLSPRLGIAYPISDTGVLHFSYGHFFQRPKYEFLYSNADFEVNITPGYNTLIGNANLEAEKTISYEFGFNQGITDILSVGVSIFQRDIRNLVSADKLVETYSPGRWYATYINRDFAEVKGIVLELNKRYSDNFSASIDYTYQIADGIASDPQDAYNAIKGDSNQEPIKQLVPLDWDRRHTLNLNFNYYVTNDWGASIISTYGSGTPFTINTGESKTGERVEVATENDGRKPTYFNVDLNMFKELNFIKSQDVKMKFVLMVKNLFDRLNENDVHKDTGRATYTTRIPDNDSGEVSHINTFEEYFLQYPQYYSRPREVRFGIELKFN